MMRTVVFMDLDDTIFQTRRKCHSDRLHVGATARDGSPMSFLTSQQRHLFHGLLADAVVIPTTARNTGAFARVHLPFPHGAILDFGGVILGPDGKPDAAWHDRMETIHRENAPLLEEAKALCDGTIAREKLTCKARIIGDNGLDFYVVVKNYNGDISELDVVRSQALGFAGYSGMTVHMNDNNLAILPFTLNKAMAVSYFLETHLGTPRRDMLVIGMGDSGTDVDFLRLCDYMLIPSRSQIAKGLS